jgi:ATP-dependent RNA helicase DeaD
MTRLFMTIGKKDNVSSAELVRAIADEAGISESSIGNINIYEKFSFVEVNEEWASRVINCLHHRTIRGRRVSVEPARGRN